MAQRWPQLLDQHINTQGSEDPQSFSSQLLVKNHPRNRWDEMKRKAVFFSSIKELYPSKRALNQEEIQKTTFIHILKERLEVMEP